MIRGSRFLVKPFASVYKIVVYFDSHRDSPDRGKAMAFPFSDRLQSLPADQREDTAADTSADWLFVHCDHRDLFDSGVI